MTQGWRDRGGRVCGVEGSVLDYFVLPLPLPLPLSLPLPSVRGEWGGASLSGCVFTFPFAFAFAFALSFALSFALGRGPNWVGGSRCHNQRAGGQEGLGGCGYVILPGGGVATFKAGAGMEPEGPCAGLGPARGGGPP